MLKPFKQILFISTLVVVLIFIITALALKKGKTLGTNNRISQVVINNHTINVEIADNDRLRGQGLSGRQTLSVNAGMLFTFPQADFHGFWMKDMRFPLDFIWIYGSTIVDITENVPPPPSGSSYDLPIYKPKLPADKVLEVNAGWVEQTGTKIRDMVLLN